jgi:dihydroxyacetone kinase-like protein
VAADREKVVAWLRALATLYEEQRVYLTELDSAIGDADHGANLARGFTAAAAGIDDNPALDISQLLKSTGMALIKNVGGASGPLYGTWFLRASAALEGCERLGARELALAFAAGTAGLSQRGKAELGDKTLLDVWIPVTRAVEDSAAQGHDLAACLATASQVAERAMEATTPLEARKGRASFLGARSVGHQDPGATSSYLLIEAARRWLS